MCDVLTGRTIDGFAQGHSDRVHRIVASFSWRPARLEACVVGAIGS